MRYHDKVTAAPPALFQNPICPTPDEIAERLVAITVTYRTFNNLIRHGQIIVHELVADDVRAFFREAYLLDFPIHSVTPVMKYRFNDWASCAANNSSGYNLRFLKSGKMSKHGIGCAFDINPRQNPCFVLDETSPLLPLQEIIPADGRYFPGSPGTLHIGNPLVPLMIKRGWTWGGSWDFPVDYQHFQIVPEELSSYV